jgi:hypothetical protein
MRLSDLLASTVVDERGHVYGKVDDVRLVQDGPLLGAFGAALRVDGIVIGRGGLGVRLGFLRGKIGAPWLLNALFTRLERRAKYVSWQQVRSYEGMRVVFAGEPGAVPTESSSSPSGTTEESPAETT